MPALNCQKQFAPAILSGAKRSTIRARRKDGRDPKPGDTLFIFTGMRTKTCRFLMRKHCTRVSALRITRRARVAVRGRWLNYDELLALALKDGFAGASQMVYFFRTTHGLPFSGLLIEW